MVDIVFKLKRKLGENVMEKFKDLMNKNKLVLILVGVSLMLIGIVVVIGLIDSQSLADDETRVPKSSSELVNKNYNDVVTLLQTAGFEDVEVEKKEDLILGILSKDGEVAEVSIAGDTVFSSDSKYLKNSKVIVRYHTFPSKSKESGNEIVEKSNSEEITKPKDDSTQMKEEEKGNEDAIINVDNDEGFAKFIMDGTANEEVIRSFVDKYSGKTIEFDGYTWDWLNHTSTSPFTGKETIYDTLFDTIITPGNIETFDVEPSNIVFRVEEVRFPNFSTSLNRRNVRVKAKVESYNDKTMQINLNVIDIQDR